MVHNQQHPADTYQAVRDELIGALRSIGGTSASTSVPSCPIWTVKDVVAHLCGLNAEVLANNPGPLGSDEATTRQVGDRASLDLNQVLDEWASMADAIDERFRVDVDKATALLADLVVHVYDLEEVLHQPTDAAVAATPVCAHKYIPLLQQRLAEEMTIALTVDLVDDTTWAPETADATTAVTVRATPHAFLRGVTGRLRRSEVEAFEWNIDPSDILDQAWNQYGSFRT